MTSPFTSFDDDSVDPTGVRALLRALPDPGPMPHEVFDRISASLREEAATRGTYAGLPDLADAGPPAQVVPLVRPARRWRPSLTGMRVLGGAAALLVAVGVGSALVSRVPLSNSDSAQSSSMGGAAAPEVARDASGEEARIGALLSTGTAFTVSGLADQARALITASTTNENRPQADLPPAAQILACLDGLGATASGKLIHVDLGTFEGQSAMLIAYDQPDTSTPGPVAFVVAPDCGITEAKVLASVNAP